MELTVQRTWESQECLIGTLSIDGATECFTLELPLQFDGQENIHNKCCIPEGRYEVMKLYSNHFGQMMPHIVNVPGRDHVMFHWGNTAANTDGCILVGQQRNSDTMIGESLAAFKEFEPKLETAWANNEQVFVTVKNIAFLTAP